jgi:hypothetical protein
VIAVESASRLTVAPSPHDDFESLTGRGTLHLTSRWAGADQRLVHKIEELLRPYGHAEFVSDGAKYKPAHA